MNREFLRLSYIARVLDVSALTVNRWVHGGDLQALNVQGAGAKRPTYRVQRTVLIEFLCRRGMSEERAKALFR